VNSLGLFIIDQNGNFIDSLPLEQSSSDIAFNPHNGYMYAIDGGGQVDVIDGNP